MIELDKWAAEQCDIDIEHSLLWKIPDRGDGLPCYFHYEWTLSDPRCMQVFREKFKVETIWTELPEMWMSESRYKGKDYSEEGETIAEAERACAEAIMEASNENT